MNEDVITVWPCSHGNVLVEHGDVPLGMTCHECGAHPRRYVAVDALLNADVIDRAAGLVPAHDIDPARTVRLVAEALFRAVGVR